MPLILAFLLERDAATKTESLKISCAHMQCMGCPMSMIFNNAASKKSHTITRPSKEPVINWKALCGLRMAVVSKLDNPLSVAVGGVRVETTSPVATECILTEEPTREKK